VPVVQERHGDVALFRHVDHCLEIVVRLRSSRGSYGPTEGELLPFKKALRTSQ